MFLFDKKNTVTEDGAAFNSLVSNRQTPTDPNNVCLFITYTLTDKHKARGWK